MDVGRLPSGGDVKAPAEGSGLTIVTTNSRCTRARSSEVFVLPNENSGRRVRIRPDWSEKMNTTRKGRIPRRSSGGGWKWG